MNVGGKGKRLVLHFDLNKTIIMKDTNKNQTSVLMTVSLMQFNYLPLRSVTSSPKLCGAK